MLFIIDKAITLISADKENKSVLNFASINMAFQLLPKAKLNVEDLVLRGNNEQITFKTLDENLTKAYDLFIKNTEISNFNSVLEVSKGSFADTVSIAKSTIKNCANGIKLNKEIDDGGDYNAEFVIIINSNFQNVANDVLNYYRGGYDESTIGGNLVLKNNIFRNCGKADSDNTLINNRGIVNIEFKDNTFKDNPVKVIAILWGEKDQKPVNNTIVNSGEIKVVQHLKLKLMY